MRWILVSFLILASCDPVVVGDKRGSAFRGKHWVSLDVTAHEGDCSSLPDKSQAEIQFNNKGEVVPPFPTVKCATTSPPFSVHCDSDFGYGDAYCTSGLEGVFPKVWCSGEATFYSNVLPCRYLALDFTIRPQSD